MFEFLNKTNIFSKGKKGGKAKAGKGKASKGKDKQDEVVEEEVVEEKVEDSGDQQLKMIDELEAGGKIEEIDLTTDDWVNVNALEMPKRYDMLRRYVINSFLYYHSNGAS